MLCSKMSEKKVYTLAESFHFQAKLRSNLRFALLLFCKMRSNASQENHLRCNAPHRKTHRMKVRIDYIAETLMCKCLLTRTVANDTYVYQMSS